MVAQPVNLDAAVERPLYGRCFSHSYTTDPEGLELMRASLLQTPDWHDRAPINCNSLARLLDTITAQQAALSASNARPSKPCEECKGTGNKHCRPIAAGDLTKYDLCTECEGTGRVSSPRFCARAVAAEEALREIAETVQISRIRHIARTTLASMKGEG